MIHPFNMIDAVDGRNPAPLGMCFHPKLPTWAVTGPNFFHELQQNATKVGLTMSKVTSIFFVGGLLYSSAHSAPA